ncbi:MAG: flagellin modification protein FlmC [Rhodospirillaceae bacterium]|nr:flagellin modification protein FlmC [Rhodospirillaceae bacterium]
MIPHSGTLALVAVRLKSSRLPRKAMADLAGKPLILRLHERVSQARLSEDVVWCTSTNPDDDPLEELAGTIGARVYRGDELDVMSRFIEVAWSRATHTIVRITGDNPLTDPEIMDQLLAAHEAAGADYTYTEDPPRGTRCEVMSLKALERCHDLAEDPKASEYMTLMIRRPDRFNVCKFAVADPALKRPELRLTIDTPQDLAVVRAVYEAFGGDPPRLKEIIAWLDAHPEIVALNSQVPAMEIDSSINVRLRGDRE